MCEWRGVRVRCHEPPHGEAVGSCLRLFHTVSEGVFSEVRRLGTRVKMTRMTDRLNALEVEILAVLRMGPETAALLTEMVAPEGGTLTEDEVRSALGRLSARGLVRPLRGWARRCAQRRARGGLLVGSHR